MSQGDDATLPDSRAIEPSLSTEIPRTDLGERYELGTVIGRGGAGEVRIARDTRIPRNVAVKLLRSNHRDDATLGRFFREARVQGVLDHPAVVPVHDLGIDPVGNPFFVMKRLTGITLGDVLTASDPETQARWPRRQLLARFIDICLAIDFAHARGVIHRDLKPANIMLGDYGEAYVLDWGLARIASDADSLDLVGPLEDQVGHTEVGKLLGTPGYMSPEQARGDHVEAATDVYALGCVLFEILAGKPALPRGMEGILAAIAGEVLRPSKISAEIPPELDDLCARATAADAKQRPTARALADGVQAFLDGDRDVLRRRELAEQHAEAAHVGMADEASDDARATAMREAGRALALDPDNAKAQHVLGHLLLHAPAKLPAEALASADHERGVTRQRAIRFAGYGYFAALPAIAIFFFLPIHHVWPIILLFVLAIMTGTACLMLSRNVLPMRTPWMVVLVTLNSMMLLVLGLIFSPLLIMPIFLIGSLGGVLQQPSTYSPSITLVAHAVPLVLLLTLERIGVLPGTFAVSPNGLEFTLWVMDLTPTITVILFGLALVTQSAMLVGVTLIGKRAAESAQNHQHAIAWHLRQMLPRANDRSDTITGRREP